MAERARGEADLSDAQPGADEARPLARRLAPLLVALLACLAAGAVLLAADRVLGLGVFPDAMSRQMQAAAEAVAPDGDDEDRVD